MEQSKFYQIKNVTEHGYTLVGCDGSVITRPIQDVDKSASVFTIEDAKDGDVLIHTYSNYKPDIFIFKKVIDNKVHIYCWCDEGDGYFDLIPYSASDYSQWMISNETVYYPSTKEQRDLLFQKMKEAGYVWNEKELKLEKI